MKATILILSVVLLSFQVANAQSQKPDLDISMGGLEASGYKTVQLLIKGQGLDRIGLTEERIRTKCELRFRQANLNPTPATALLLSHLLIVVHVFSEAFSISIQFNRMVSFMANGKEYQTIGTTWEKCSLGTHSGDPEYVTKNIDKLLDYFLNEYLKANAK